MDNIISSDAYTDLRMDLATVTAEHISLNESAVDYSNTVTNVCRKNPKPLDEKIKNEVSTHYLYNGQWHSIECGQDVIYWWFPYLIVDQVLDEGELLGSLVTMNSPAVRTSARVIQKMKLDSIRPTTPPMPEKKEPAREDRGTQKTPNHTRASKTIWTNVERNLFFEALNEYGKDFDSIAQYINMKQKRKNATDPAYKAKENVRQLYYQSYHKVSKYLRFSDGKFVLILCIMSHNNLNLWLYSKPYVIIDIKKNVQELYALINYGEMRKRVTNLLNQKCFMKLRELVYKGWVSLRWKGKTYRIKTPSCKALRKINQVEGEVNYFIVLIILN